MFGQNFVELYRDYIQTYGLVKNEKGHCKFHFSVPEIKILLLLGYFIVFDVVTLVNLSIGISEADGFYYDLLEYFECNLFGSDPRCVAYRQKLERHLKPGLNATAFIMLGLLPWVHLLFAVQAHDVKQLMKKIMIRCQAKRGILVSDAKTGY